MENDSARDGPRRSPSKANGFARLSWSVPRVVAVQRDPSPWSSCDQVAVTGTGPGLLMLNAGLSSSPRFCASAGTVNDARGITPSRSRASSAIVCVAVSSPPPSSRSKPRIVAFGTSPGGHGGSVACAALGRRTVL
jgi:hypothetical protein